MALLLMALPAVPSGADDVVVDLSNAPSMEKKAAIAPGGVSFIAINPLIFPQWSVTVDNVIKAGPNPPLLSSGSTAISAVDDGLKNGASAIKDDGDGTTLAGFTPVKVDGSTPSMCKFDVQLNSAENAKRLKRVEQCSSDVNSRWYGLVARMDKSQHDLQVATTRFTEAQRMTGSTLASAAARGTNLNPDLPVEEKIRKLDAAIKTELIDGAYKAEIERVDPLLDWPSDEIASLQSDISTLKTVLSVESEPKSKAKPDRDEQALADQRKRILPTLDRRLAIVTSAAAGGAAEKNYTAGLRALKSFTNRMRGITPSRFRFSAREDCRGINNSRREVTYVLSLSRDSTHTIQLVCQSRIFLSEGIMFSALPQRQFVGAPRNPLAGIPSGGVIPSPLPSPRNVISSVANTNARPIAMVLANYNVSKDANNRFLLSLGAGLASGAEKTFVDYVAGVSYSISRTVVFTIGEHLGQETILAPGFKEGDLVEADPKTTTRYRLAPFIGFSFGKQ